jgi:DNA-binding NarL/FixJ family response regulator
MRIAIVDDHALFRSGLAGVVERELGATVVHEGCDPGAVLDLVPLPDVLLLDLDLGSAVADPHLAGRIQAAGCRVLVVSALADAGSVAAMLDAGVSGFVSKREAPETLVEAITEVMADGTWTSPEVAALVLTSPRRPALSEVQERVLTLYASGMKLDSVARVVGISPGTAATHLKRARAKYAVVGRDASSRVDLYRQALRDGLIRE